MQDNTMTDHIRTADMFSQAFPEIAFSNYVKALSGFYDLTKDEQSPLNKDNSNYDNIIKSRDFILERMEKYPKEASYELSNIIIEHDKLYAAYLLRGLAKLRTIETKSGMHDIFFGIKNCPIFAQDMFNYLINEDKVTDVFYIFRGLVFEALGKTTEANDNINFFFDMNPDSKEKLLSDSELVDAAKFCKEIMESI